MRYLFAIVLPPVAVLMCGKPFQFLLNILLTCCFVIPGMLHALMVVSQFNAERRHRELIRAVAFAGTGRPPPPAPPRHSSFRMTR